MHKLLASVRVTVFGMLRTVLQLPEPWREVAEVFVVQCCLGRQPVLWEALEEPGGQLLSMVHIAQPGTHKHTLSDTVATETNIYRHVGKHSKY